MQERRFSESQRRDFERLLVGHGRQKLEKSRRTLQRRLSAHQDKFEEIRRAGGHTSYIEGEIRNLAGQIAAIEAILKS